MKVENEILVYEVNDQQQSEYKLIIRNDGSLYPKCVILEWKGERLLVRADQLGKAIRNALNV